MPAFQPYRGKPAVRNVRGDRGNVGIIRSPVRASILPDQTALVERGLQIPTIFVTAFLDPTVKRRALDAGAVGFLTKPCNGKDLRQLIQDAIRQGGENA